MQGTNENTAVFQWSVILGASLIAAFWDLKSRRIPNWLTLPLFVLGLVQAVWFGGLDSLGNSFLAAMILALPYMLLYLFAGGGAGDAKLMAAAGAWLGLYSGMTALFCISICAIILALLKAAFVKRFAASVKNIVMMGISIFWIMTSRGAVKMSDTDHDPVTIPYGLAIFAGLISAAIYSWTV